MEVKTGPVAVPSNHRRDHELARIRPPLQWSICPRWTPILCNCCIFTRILLIELLMKFPREIRNLATQIDVILHSEVWKEIRREYVSVKIGRASCRERE